MKIFFLACLVIVIVLSYIRFSKPDQSLWHVDPEEVSGNNLKNSYLINSKNKNKPAYSLEVNELYHELNKIVLEDRCKKVFGNVKENLITYVCRSKVFGFPDYISVSFSRLDDGRTSLAIFSRSRFGLYDFEKNIKRIDRWLEKLKSAI